MGTLITETGTWHHAIDIPELLPGKGFVELEIEYLNLLPGSYSLSLSINGPWKIIYDQVEHCVKLEVEGSSDIYQTTKAMDSQFGIVYFPQRWHLGQLRHTVLD